MPVCPDCGNESPELGRPCSVCEEGYFVADHQVERATSDPYIGRRVDDKYVVVGCIDEGGMGTVYRAIQQPVGRKVALKVLRGDFDDDAEIAHRFRREARALSELGHPNVITLFDFGVDARDGLYMVMEFALGASLQEWQQRRSLNFDRIADVFAQVLSALAYAHDRGIVHRDLKPGNVVMVRDGPRRDFVKVLDFGIARMLNERSDGRITAEGEVYGTPIYMSPEQTEGDVEIRPPADVYSAGIMLFELLSGDPPFSGDPLVVMRLHREESLPPLEIRSELTVPDGIGEVIDRATRKSPDERFADARGMLEALRDTTSETTADSPERDAFREITPDEISDEEVDDEVGVDWESYDEHAPASRDPATRRPDRGGRLLGRSGRVLEQVAFAVGGLALLVAAFAVIGARFSDFDRWLRAAIASTPVVGAIAYANIRASRLRFRVLCRTSVGFGTVGFVAAHLPNPTALATPLRRDPVWFLRPLADVPGVTMLARWWARGSEAYADLLVSVFGG